MRRQLLKLGYVHVPGVLSTQEVDYYRSYINDVLQKFTLPGMSSLRQSQNMRMKELAGLMLLPKIVRVLKELLGDPYVTIPDLKVDKNLFAGCRNWHTDSASEYDRSKKRLGAIPSHLKKSDYTFLKCAIYLQGNSKEWGGGIEIIPRSHLFSLWGDPFSVPNYILRKIYTKMRMRIAPYRVPIKGGDFLAFDSRLLHCGTTPQAIRTPEIKSEHMMNMPEEHAKYTVYWDACNRQSLREFWLNSIRRSRQENDPDSYLFFDYTKLKYPDDYPPEFVRKLSENNILLASNSLC